MCESCYRDRGSPKIDTPDVRTAAKLIEVIYDYSAVGVPFHVHLDDWNLDGIWESCWGDDEDEYEPEHRTAAAVLGELVKTMTSEERASARGLQEGFWAIERWEKQ